ncbi:DUF1861 family protein [Lapidilactobacillus mulanensis]
MMKSTEILVKEHRRFNQSADRAAKLTFIGVDGDDVYNTSVVFELNQKTYLAGRTEKRDSELSETKLFEQIGSSQFRLVPDFGLPLQDPFITLINGQVILGGVKVDWTDPQSPIWRTEFYLLKADLTTELILTGPKKMKDIRLCQLNNGRILILTRPQGDTAGLGKIGMLIVDDLQKVTPSELVAAPLLKNNFADENWGGANQIFQVSDQVVFVAGHIASMVNDERHYYALAFYVDLASQQILGEHLLAERQDFLAGPSKRDDLADVVFTSGIVKNEEKLLLFCGTSDCEEQCLEISQDTL